MDLSAFIERAANRTPDKLALHFEGAQVTYASLWKHIVERTESLAVARGDRVAWLGFNDPEMLVLFFALARRGAILVPLNWRLTAAEQKEVLADCSPRLLLASEDFAARKSELSWPEAAAPADRTQGQEEDDALIVYTSGTTGKPKGAV
ncbi:MAG: AMP-binding protein, partial [Betaproteobacteria bacterium]|nr:AMP-binding protein [Betaproteobacteria bacterium]